MWQREEVQEVLRGGEGRSCLSAAGRRKEGQESLRRKVWTFSPGTGGKAIPEAVKSTTEARIRRYAGQHFRGKFTGLDIRFRGPLCYVDAHIKDDVDGAPMHLCRLRYFGPEQWGFGFYAYSSEKYETSVLASGKFFGTPEEAFHSAATCYLS